MYAYRLDKSVEVKKKRGAIICKDNLTLILAMFERRLYDILYKNKHFQGIVFAVGYL